jgi:hypothetical protein
MLFGEFTMLGISIPIRPGQNQKANLNSTDGLPSPHAPSVTDYLGLSAVAGPVRFNHATGTSGGSGANINNSSFGRSDIEAALKALNANPHKKFEGFGPQFDRAYPRVAELLKEAPKHGGGPTSAALIAMEKACLEIRDQERRVRKSGNELGANMIAAAAPIYRLLAMTAGQMENHYAVTAINLAIDRGDILNKQRGSLAKSQGAQSSLTFGDKLLIGLGYVPSCALLGTTAWIALSNSSWGSTEIIQGLAGVGMSVVAAAINYGYAKKLEDTRS